MTTRCLSRHARAVLHIMPNAVSTQDAKLQQQRARALFLRFASRFRAACARVYQQLGHREREAVYQRALAAEFEALGYTCVCEHPVPVTYVASDGRQRTLAHERAGIAVWSAESVIVVEVKRGSGVASLNKEGLQQARRYGAHLERSGTKVGGVCAATFDKTARASPLTSSESWL